MAYQYGLNDYYTEIVETIKTPERSLLTAILERAICDLFGNRTGNKKKRVYRRKYYIDPQMQALEWFSSPDTVEWTYLWLCQHLDLDAKILKDYLFVLLEGGQRIRKSALYGRTNRISLDS